MLPAWSPTASRIAKTTLTLALIVACAPRTTARCYPPKASRAAPADLITLCAACRKAMSMSDGDLSDQIARIESDIEQLAETLDGCRKAMLFSKVVITAGGIWILAYFLGAMRFDPMAMIASIAAIIGGVVVFGSNSSTSKQAMTAMKVAETQRAELIDMIDLRAIGGSETHLQRLGS